MAVVGYARVSARDQDLSIQLKQLEDAGCTRIFAEKRTGTNLERPELAALLNYVRDGDVVMVTRLDRLARSMADFFKTLGALKEKGVEFRAILQPEIDTTTVNGRLVTGILAAIAEFETEIRRERQREGIEAAKLRGVYKQVISKGGYKAQHFANASRLLRKGKSYKDVEEITGIPASTLRRHIPQSKRGTPTADRSIRSDLRYRNPNPPSAPEGVEETKTEPDTKGKPGFLGRLFKG